MVNDSKLIDVSNAFAIASNPTGPILLFFNVKKRNPVFDLIAYQYKRKKFENKHLIRKKEKERLTSAKAIAPSSPTSLKAKPRNSKQRLFFNNKYDAIASAPATLMKLHSKFKERMELFLVNDSESNFAPKSIILKYFKDKFINDRFDNKTRWKWSTTNSSLILFKIGRLIDNVCNDSFCKRFEVKRINPFNSKPHESNIKCFNTWLFKTIFPTAYCPFCESGFDDKFNEIRLQSYLDVSGELSMVFPLISLPSTLIESKDACGCKCDALSANNAGFNKRKISSKPTSTKEWKSEKIELHSDSSIWYL